MDIIAASATPLVNNAAIAIIRLSGGGAVSLIRKIFTSKNPDFANPKPNVMYLGTILAKGVKDRAFFVYFKEPKSFTGEEMVELHVHGGVSVANNVLRTVYELGARPATEGEFTKRAFLNKKLTLDEAEGILDIINAQSQAEAMQAYRLLSGELSKTIYNVEGLLLEALANVDAVLDYPDELEDDLMPITHSILKECKDILSKLLEGSKNRKYITDGITLTLAGLTNVGKSSLMNAILKDERAIVTDIAGTTRDTLKESIEINGIRLNIIDTAGIRQSQETVESIGIERAKKAILGADLVLFVIDLAAKETKEEKELLLSFKEKDILLVGNKGDIALRNPKVDIVIEAKNGKNIEALVDMIFDRLNFKADVGLAVLTRERHIFAIKEALSFIENAIDAFNIVTTDCLSVDIKAAYSALTEITGADAKEAVVDKIFSSFCVGK